MKSVNDPALFGVIIYRGVEPIDIGGTIGVISMARRILPGVSSIAIAAHRGFVQLAGGLSVLAESDFASHPECDQYIVCGGPGWVEQAADATMLSFIEALPTGRVASVCTGALILAAAGRLDGRRATTRRAAVGAEVNSPLDQLADLAPRAEPLAAAIVEDQGVVTSGGVSLAIDGTLYLIGRLYGIEARDEIARLIEYDRAFAANAAALGHIC